MIRTAKKYYLKEVPLLASQIGRTIPIYMSQDGRKMSLEASSIQGVYTCWNLEVREDEHGQYCEMPLEEDEMRKLLGRFLKK